jgi:hypothetical protein
MNHTGHMPGRCACVIVVGRPARARDGIGGCDSGADLRAGDLPYWTQHLLLNGPLPSPNLRSCATGCCTSARNSPAPLRPPRSASPPAGPGPTTSSPHFSALRHYLDPLSDNEILSTSDQDHEENPASGRATPPAQASPINNGSATTQPQTKHRSIVKDGS